MRFHQLLCQYAIAGAVSVLILGVFLGIKTSIQTAGSSKPFSMEGFDKKDGRGRGQGFHASDFNPRDTSEDDLPNGDWLEDPM